MKLLVTRPAHDAVPLAELLTAAGHEVLVDPLLEIRIRDRSALDLDGVTGLLFTSGNGVRALASLTDRRDFDVYAVGDRTATLARELGFTRIQSADGDVEALAALVQGRRQPTEGMLLHASGADAAGELARQLEAAGYAVRRAVLYEAEPAAELAPATRAALADGTLDGVILFSPRTARHFAALLNFSGQAARARGLVAWCLSPAVAEALDGLAFADLKIAPHPTQAALLALIPAGSGAIPGQPVRPKEEVLTEAPPPKGPSKKKTRVEPSLAAALPADEAVPAPTTAAAAAAADEAAAPVEPPAGTPPRRRIVPIAVTGIVALVVLGGVAVFWPQIKDRLDNGGPAAPAPQASVETPPTPPAESRPAPPAAAPSDGAPAQQPAPDAQPPVPAPAPAPAPTPEPAATTGALGDLQQKLGALAQRVGSLEQKPAVDPASLQALAAKLDDAVNRIGKLEAQVQQQAAGQRNEKAAVLALAELKDRLAGSGPFDGPVAVLKASSGDDPSAAPALATLDRFAAHGVESRAKLAAELNGLPAAINQPLAPAADAGLWDRITARAERLVSVRRIDDEGHIDKLPAGPDHSLAVAIAAMKGGDLAGAIQAVQELTGHPAEVAKPWLDAAQDRLAVEQAVDRLGTAATQRLQQAGAPRSSEPTADQAKPQ